MTLQPLLLALLLLGPGGCSSAREGGEEVTIYPEVLYGGKNVISVSAPSGIESVKVIFSNDKTYETTRLMEAGRVEGCPTTHDLSIGLDPHYTSDPSPIGLEIVTCGKTQIERRFSTPAPWSLDTVLFSESKPGEESCAFFQVASGALPVELPRNQQFQGQQESIIVVDVTSPDPRIRVSTPGALPHALTLGRTFRYEVCFSSDTAGEFRIPVIAWLKRDFPNRGLVSYAVADTAVIRVIRHD